MSDRETLRAALKPFAEAMRKVTTKRGHGWTTKDCKQPGMNDFRRAAEAYAALEAQPDSNREALRAALKALAEKATPGPWVAAMTGRGMEVIQLVNGKWAENVCRWTGDHPSRQSNMNYIAATNPTVILDLIAALEAATAPASKGPMEADVERVAKAIEDALDKFQMVDGSMDTKYIARAALRALATAPAKGPTEAVRISQLEELLTEIGNFAHDRSTGPAVPDAYWSIRDMAQSAFETSDERTTRVRREVASEVDINTTPAAALSQGKKP